VREGVADHPVATVCIVASGIQRPAIERPRAGSPDVVALHHVVVALHPDRGVRVVRDIRADERLVDSAEEDLSSGERSRSNGSDSRLKHTGKGSDSRLKHTGKGSEQIRTDGTIA
jgi:hypothetical protein